MSTVRARCIASIIAVTAIVPVTAVIGASRAAAATHTTTARHGLGLTPVAHHQVATPRLRLGATPLPTSVDLSPWAVPVGDQGTLSSCVTWAIDYAMLGWYSRHQGHVGEPFAPMYAYSQIEAANGWQDEGADVDEAYTIAEQQGIDTQADYPQGTNDWRDLPTDAQHVAAAAHKTTGFHYLYASWPNPAGAAAQPAIEGALAAAQPVALSIPVYGRFERLTSTSDTMTAADATGTLLGYHEVLAIGYDATGVRIQNSWGTSWGDAGFATLGWDFVAGYSLDASVMTGFVDAPTVVSPTVTPVVTPTVTPPVVPTAVPTVTGLDPAQGPSYGGTTVTIHGNDLTGVTGVQFGDVPAASFVAVDDTTVTAVAPPTAGGNDVDVHVTTSTGTSAVADGDRFSYRTPTVSKVTPSNGRTAGGNTVTLTGTALSLVTQVSFGDVAAQRWWHVGDTAIAAVTPAHAAGAVQLVVTAGPVDTVVSTFRYVGAPVIKHIVRHGRRMDIWGRGLSTALRVQVGARTGRIVSVRSDRHLVVALPTGAGRVQVRVSTHYGRSLPTAASRFRYSR